MNYEKATREELLKIVNDLQLENNSLKLSYERGVARLKSIEGVLSQKSSGTGSS